MLNTRREILLLKSRSKEINIKVKHSKPDVQNVTHYDILVLYNVVQCVYCIIIRRSDYYKIRFFFLKQSNARLININFPTNENTGNSDLDTNDRGCSCMMIEAICICNQCL